MIIDIVLFLLVLGLIFFRFSDKRDERNESNNSIENDNWLSVFVELDKIKGLYKSLVLKIDRQNFVYKNGHISSTKIITDTRQQLINLEDKYQETFKNLLSDFDTGILSMEKRLMNRLSKNVLDAKDSLKKLSIDIEMVSDKGHKHGEELDAIVRDFEQEICKIRLDYSESISDSIEKIEKDVIRIQKKTIEFSLDNYKKLDSLINNMGIETDNRLIGLKNIVNSREVEIDNRLGSVKNFVDSREVEIDNRLVSLKELAESRDVEIDNRLVSLKELAESRKVEIDNRLVSLKEFVNTKFLDSDDRLFSLEKFDRECGVSSTKTNKNIESIRSSIERVGVNEKSFSKFINRQNKITKNLENLVNKSNVFNYNTFQVFSRRFVRKDYDESIKPLLNVFNLEFGFGSIGYLAHKICKIEEACIGRLATNIQDALIRLITVLGLGKENCKILEIGTLFGINLCIVEELSAAYGMKIDYQIIDPLDGYYKSGALDIVTKQKINSENFWHNIKKTGLDPNKFELIKGFSHHKRVIDRVEPNSTDLIFVDGDHTKKGVALDIRNYHKKLRKGGFFVFDDYNSKQWPEVRIAVDASHIIKTKFEFVGFAFRTVIYKKK